MRSRITKSVLLSIVLLLSFNNSFSNDKPSHPRPYFMPQNELARIFDLISKEPWAKTEFQRIKKLAKTDGYHAAFIYALLKDDEYLPVAKKYLLKYANNGGDLGLKRRKQLLDDDFFKSGQPWLGDVYYKLDIQHMVAYDWIYSGLSKDERNEIEKGILTSAHFRMRAMNRWSQTPNLMFKPTFMVAMAGLVTQNQEAIQWGFHRLPDSGRGGYFSVLDIMLRGGGPWQEAPIYPIAHKDLWAMSIMSRYLNLYNGKDWFAHKMPSGGSPKGLIDYYLDTAYPIEQTGHGIGQIRIATYGDGATSPGNSDLFLVNPAGHGRNAEKALIAAYNTSADPRYASLLNMVQDYKPDLWDKRPLPKKTKLPPAPSNIWPEYGLAMLRSDESSSYWNNGKAIAVTQLMSQGYGHDHRDKFGIMLHGAGRLLYPDYNALQYENPAIGWSRNSVSHNTVIVDEQDTKNATPTEIRHEFTKEVKFLATTASDVFDGVNQTRALLLTKEYLLDLFKLSSELPHSYDYLLHAFGEAKPGQIESFKPSRAMEKRFWLVDNWQALKTDNMWSLDFTREDKPGSLAGNYGEQWYKHRASIRVTMAAAPNTLVSHGRWGKELAQLVSDKSKGKLELDQISMLAARRDNTYNTTFVTTHEPYANDAKPGISRVAVLAQTEEATLVRIDSTEFTDYAAMSFSKRPTEHILGNGKTSVRFRNYGYIRVDQKGNSIARGNWQGLRLPGAKGSLSLNGKDALVEHENGTLVYGDLNPITTPKQKQDSERVLPVTTTPGVVRGFVNDNRQITLSIKNTTNETITGHIKADLADGFSFRPEAPTFGPLKPGKTIDVKFTIRFGEKTGKQIIPYKLVLRTDNGDKFDTPSLPLTVAVGPSLESIYQHPKPAVYRVHAPNFTIDLDMKNGLIQRLADDDGTVRLDGNPLFTYSDGESEQLGTNTQHAFVWAKETPADIQAHAKDRSRWQAMFPGRRVSIRMNGDWTQFDRTYFTLPGKWVSPGGSPRWKRIIAVDDKKLESDVSEGSKRKIAAAELEFPGGAWNMAFQFQPPQEVTFRGTEMKFSIGSQSNDKWSTGFIRPGELDKWRGK